MALRTDVIKWFTDPISLQEMVNPVNNQACGHTFERIQIEGWRDEQRTRGENPTCPLSSCSASIGELQPNALLTEALAILNLPQNLQFDRVEDLTDQERTVVQRAVQTIVDRSIIDDPTGVPLRIEQPR